MGVVMGSGNGVKERMTGVKVGVLRRDEGK